jgi:hypothetical protein
LSNVAAKIGKRRLRALSVLLLGMIVGGGALTGVASSADDGTNVVYVVSRSGSMGAPGGACGTKLACVKAAVTAANAAARDGGSVSQTGLAISNLAGAARDVDFGARGTQLLVSPGHDGNRNGRADVADAAHRLSLGGATCYACGLDGAQTILGSSSGRNVIVFVADRPNQVGPGLSSIGSFDSNTVIRAIAVGPRTTCGPTRLKVGRGGRTEVAVASLAPVATLTSGGSCTHVSGFGSLAEAVTSAVG